MGVNLKCFETKDIVLTQDHAWKIIDAKTYLI